MTRKGKARMSVLALCGGRPAVQRPRPRWPVAGEIECAWMEGVLRSGEWSWMGPHETAFCREFANFIGAKYCLCVANGTVSLEVALQAVGVEPGDEVIVPGLTWVATVQAPINIGANAVIVDIDPETWNIDPRAIESAVTSRTRAIIPVHLYGCMADMDAIVDVARRHNLKVVEDVAHQHGSRWRNRGAGAIGDVGSFSFQQSKVLTCGEGGAVTCNDEAVYNIAFPLKHVGWGPDMKPAGRYAHNYRITEMQAVLLRGGLRRLPEETRRREENAATLAEGLARLGGPLRAARRDPRVTRQAYYCMTLHFDPRHARGVSRAEYLAALNAEGFPAGAPYEPVYRHKLLNFYDKTSPIPYRDPKRVQNYAALRLPVVEKVCDETGVVLSHPALLGSDEYIGELLTAVRKVNDNLTAVWRHFAAQKKAAEKCRSGR